jgi:lipoprotein-anchoring transpeptidase ErfK/SrfK
MRLRWIIWAILAIVPAASSSAQQSHLDSRQQIEQPTPSTGSNAGTPSTGINSAIARPDSNSAGSETSISEGQKAAVLVDIDKTNQTMTVFLDGVEKYDWPVSTGRAGYSTPSGTYTATFMN